jgi:hypothetical protein
MQVTLLGNITAVLCAGGAVYGMPFWPLTSLAMAFIAGVLTALLSQYPIIIQGEQNAERPLQQTETDTTRL